MNTKFQELVPATSEACNDQQLRLSPQARKRNPARLADDSGMQRAIRSNAPLTYAREQH